MRLIRRLSDKDPIWDMSHSTDGEAEKERFSAFDFEIVPPRRPRHIVLWRSLLLLTLCASLFGLVSQSLSLGRSMLASLPSSHSSRTTSPTPPPAALVSSGKSELASNAPAVPIFAWKDAKPILTGVPVKSDENHPECHPGLFDDMVVVLKSGAAVVYDRAFVHMQTTMRCIPHKIFVSDAAMTVGSMQFIDVLQDLNRTLLSNKAFDFYRTMQEANRNGEDVKALGQRSGKKGWTLDKFKFIPMAKRAWEARRPTTKWFVFIEADSLIDWANLRVFLSDKDATQPLFYGKPSYVKGVPFAHGGSGFVISHGAMQRSVGRSPEAWMQKWADVPLHNCCGDFVLSEALKHYGVNFTNAKPLFQQDPPESAPLMPMLWCRPVVTMHHIKPQQVASYWQLAEQAMEQVYQGKRNHSLLWNDVYGTMIEPSLRRYRLDWDNISPDWGVSEKRKPKPNDEERLAMLSPAGCEALCQTKADCMQWNHHGKECWMGRNLRVGVPVEKEQAKAGTTSTANWISGWMLERIRMYKELHQDCEGGANFQLVKK